MERWIKCGGCRFNLHHITHLDVRETEEEDVFAVTAHFFGSYYTSHQIIVVDDRDAAWQIVDDIIAGKYDMETPPAFIVHEEA